MNHDESPSYNLGAGAGVNTALGVELMALDAVGPPAAGGFALAWETGGSSLVAAIPAVAVGSAMAWTGIAGARIPGGIDVTRMAAARRPPGATPRIPTNRAGQPYPQVPDPRHPGQMVPFPSGPLRVVAPSQRVPWTTAERGAFIREWYDRGYQTPPGGWGAYDIHHIRPREYGGGNEFKNLVPLERSVHQNFFTAWWNSF